MDEAPGLKIWMLALGLQVRNLDIYKFCASGIEIFDILGIKVVRSSNRLIVGSGNTTAISNFLKQQRAHGGCLGIERRRRTW
jgi:hypothetical protein